MLDLILLGMLSATAIMLIAHTVDEARRPFESHPPHRTREQALPDKPDSRFTIEPAAGNEDDEREAARD